MRLCRRSSSPMVTMNGALYFAILNGKEIFGVRKPSARL
jgi:hypothetical protein